MLFEGDAEPTPPEGLVIVGRFESPVEAQMAKGALESAGIESFLVGENANIMLSAAFRVRLQVREEDEAAAREIMAQSAGDLTGEASRKVEPDWDWGGEAAEPGERRRDDAGGS
jgi:hypothetical protein